MSKQDGRSRQVTTGPVDDATATILHMDMDAFFASVELLARPDLKGRPVIVGHPSARSVVTAATYEARLFGVNSAMPMAVAMRRCPQAVILPPHYSEYQRYSSIVMEICGDFTPRVEVLGIDEAFLDVSGAGKLFGGPMAVAQAIRKRVLDETGLVCSIGAAATKYVAKVASSKAKPDGLLVVPEHETLAFLHPLPISALWGVGGKTEERMLRRGFRTIGDVAATPLEVLQRSLGQATGSKLHALSLGRDPRRVTPGVAEKSVGHESTFFKDLTDHEDIRRELLRLSELVAVRMRKHRTLGRTVQLKLRYGDFTTITRSKTLSEPTDVAHRIAEAARDLHDAVGPHPPVRLLGVRMEQLTESAPTLLWDEDEDWREAEHTIDAVSERFGRGAVQRASLVKRKEPPERPFVRGGASD